MTNRQASSLVMTRSLRRARRFSPLTGGLLLCLWTSGGCHPFPEDAPTQEPEPASAPASAQEIVDRYVTAMGGKKALKKLPQRTVEAKLVFMPQEGCQPGNPSCVAEQTEGSLLLHQTADGKMFSNMEVGGRKQKRGFDGKTGWQFQVEPPLLLIDNDDRAAATREDALLHWYFDYQARGVSPEIRPARTIPADGDKPARELDGVLWVSKHDSLAPREMWFDRSTGLLFEEVERDTDTAEMVKREYGDYRKVDGVMVAFRIKQTAIAQGPAQEVTIDVEHVHHKPAAVSDFAPPKIPKPKPQPDPLLHQLKLAQTEAEKDPKEATAQMAYGRVAYAAGHFELAAAQARKVLKLDPKDPEAVVILASVELLGGKLKSADKLLRRATKLHVKPSMLQRQRAWLEIRRGNWKKAATALRAAYDALPELPPDDQGRPQDKDPWTRSLSERYEAFEGKPVQTKFGGDGCVSELKLEDPKIFGPLPVVKLDVDGEPLRFIFDTAAADLIISESTARRLVVGTDAQAPFAIGGPLVPQGQIERVKLGTLEISNVPAIMLPDQMLAQTTRHQDVHGVLGSRIFANTQLTIDPAQGTMQIVRNSSRCKKALAQRRSGKSVKFWIHEVHHMYVLAKIEGAEGLFLVNSGIRGADIAAGDPAFARAGIASPPIRENQPRVVQVRRFELGDHQGSISGAFHQMPQNVTSDGFRIDGMVGYGALGRGRVTFDFPTQTIYLDPAAAPANKPAANKPAANKPAENKSNENKAK